MILVTGSTGLVGSHLLLELLKSGEKVRAIYRDERKQLVVKRVFSYYLPEKEANFLFDSIEWVLADILDIPSLNKAFQNVKHVYHCAAIISLDAKKAKQLRATNIEGTANIVNACLHFNVEKLCHLSSIAAMDLALGEEQVSENFTWYPEKEHSDYAISKYGGEMEVWRGTQEGLPSIVLNPGVIIGPGFWDSGSGKIFKKIDAGLKYHFPKITGFVGVQDVVSAAVILMNSENKNEQFILVSENLSFEKVLGLAAKSIKKKEPSQPLKPWMVFIGWLYESIADFLWGGEKQLSRNDYKSLFENRYYSNHKIKDRMGFVFTPLKEVINKTGRNYLKDISKLRISGQA